MRQGDGEPCTHSIKSVGNAADGLFSFTKLQNVRFSCFKRMLPETQFTYFLNKFCAFLTQNLCYKHQNRLTLRLLF